MVQRLGSWITNSWVFYFAKESLISIKVFDFCCDRKEEGISWLRVCLFFFNWVGRVNLEYQPSHPSPINSRPSLGINLYLVSNLSWLASRWIRLDESYRTQSIFWTLLQKHTHTTTHSHTFVTVMTLHNHNRREVGCFVGVQSSLRYRRRTKDLHFGNGRFRVK